MSFSLLQRMMVAVLAILCIFPATASSSTGQAESVERGRDVGDGQVLYDTPYDPKSVPEVTFVSPTVRHPYYEIVVPLGDWTEGKSANVSKVRVNGLEADAYYVFVDGFSHVQSAWITRDAPSAKNVVLVIRSLWHNEEAIKGEIDITVPPDDKDPKASGTKTKTFEAVAPTKGGGPKGWKRYQSLVLRETAGLPRRNEPVEVSIVVNAEACADLEKELRLFIVDPEKPEMTPVPVQTYNPKAFAGTPPGTSDTNYLQHPSHTVEGVFLATVPAHGAQVYLFVYDNPDASTPDAIKSDLSITGNAVGAVIENEFYTIKLDDKCGQIAYFEIKGRKDKPAPRLTNSLTGAAHWNPDSFSDNGKWGHTFAWNPPDQTHVSARGPLLFRVTNSGRMPDSTPQVQASVTYSFYAGLPYVKATTVTEVRDPLNTSAIRNGELVLDSHLVSHFVWREKTGELHSTRTLHGPNWQDEWANRVDQDVPWIAMANEAENYAVGEAVESSIAFNPKFGEATTHRPAFYLYYHHFWRLPLTYFTRAWVYPFSDNMRGPILPVDAGSTYVDKVAFIPFSLREGDERYKDIENVSAELKTPLVQRWGR